MLPIILQLPPKRRATTTYTQRVIALSPIAYWPLAESSGSVAVDASGNARNGAYTSVTLGAEGIGDGRTAATFTNNTSYADVYTASLAGAFNGDLGTLAAWAKVSAAGVWTDGAQHYILAFVADGSNYVLIRKNSTTNQITYQRSAGGTQSTVQDTTGAGTLAWFHVAVTWNRGGNEFRAYLNGAQVGTTQAASAAFVGSLAAATTLIGGVNKTPTLTWSGTLAHAAVWTSALSAADVAALATL